jgi:hypothetical protein
MTVTRIFGVCSAPEKVTTVPGSSKPMGGAAMSHSLVTSGSTGMYTRCSSSKRSTLMLSRLSGLPAARSVAMLMTTWVALRSSQATAPAIASTANAGSVRPRIME